MKASTSRKCASCDSRMVRRYSVGGFDVWMCARQDLMTIGPLPTSDEIAQYYQRDYSLNVARARKRMAAEAHSVLEQLEQYSAPSRLLEVGSSYGFFLMAAESRGWAVTGVEPSLGAAESSRKYVRGEVIAKILEEAFPSNHESMFEAVVMLHVIEHFLDPRSQCRRLARLLAPGGLMFITTPNLHSLQYRVLGRWWEWVQIPEHLWYFSSQSLCSMLEKEGFEVLSVQTRRGGSLGLIAGMLLAPVRIAQAVRRTFRDRPKDPPHPDRVKLEPIASGPDVFHSVARRVPVVLKLAVAPLDWATRPVRETVYRRGLGPELVVLARKLSAPPSVD